MRRRSLIALALAVLLLGSVGAAAAATHRASGPAAKPLVKKLRTQSFGPVLATATKHALYYWTPEKKKPGTIVCTGACARAWPVLFVPAGMRVPKKLPGFTGTFGTIRRPDGRRQLTYNRLPLYTYAHEDAGQVRCDNVNGWFVVRL
jgi:predicted lipoprotein with Yx(FWY)xxD motif